MLARAKPRCQDVYRLWLLVFVLFFTFAALAQGAQAQETGPERCEVVVVGAGLGGLRAALALADKDVAVLGGDSAVEALAGAADYHGLRFDPVFVAIYRPGESLNRLLGELGIKAGPVGAPETASWQQQVVYAGPGGFAAMLADKVGLDEANRLIELVAGARQRLGSADQKEQEAAWRALDRLNFAFWLADADMPAFVMDVFNALCRSRFGVPSGEISAAAALQAIGAGVLPDAPLSLASVARTDGEMTAPAEVPALLHALPGGTSSLAEAMQKRLGARFVTGTMASRVEPDGQGGWRIHYKKDGRDAVLRAKAVILATSAKRALELAGPGLDERLRALLAQETSASAVTVHLFSKEPLWTKSFELFVPQGSLLTHLYAKNPAQSGDAAPRLHVTSVRLTSKNSRDHALLDFDDNSIMQAVRADMERIAPGGASKVTGQMVLRHLEAFPVNGVGSAARKIEMGKLSGSTLVLGGDYLAGLGVNGSVEAGELAAARLRAVLEGGPAGAPGVPVPPPASGAIQQDPLPGQPEMAQAQGEASDSSDSSDSSGSTESSEPARGDAPSAARTGERTQEAAGGAATAP